MGMPKLYFVHLIYLYYARLKYILAWSMHYFVLIGNGINESVFMLLLSHPALLKGIYKWNEFSFFYKRYYIILLCGCVAVPSFYVVEHRSLEIRYT